MDIVEYLSKSINMYFGRINEGIKYIDKNVSMWDAVIVYYFIVLLSMIASTLSDTSSYGELGANTSLLVIIMFIASLVITPIMILVGYGLIHLFLKWFGGKRPFSDTVKFGLSTAIFSGIIGTITSVLTNIIMLNLGNYNLITSISVSIVLMFISVAVGIWGLVIISQTLGKIHGISAPKAFLAIILPWVIIVVLIFMLAIVIGLVVALSYGM